MEAEGTALKYGLPLPPELCTSIVSYLSHKDRLAFCACSRYSRTVGLPMLVETIQVRPESILVFKKGGKYHDLCKNVRCITLIGLDAYNEGSCMVTLTLTRFYLSWLNIFPNISHLRVSFHFAQIGHPRKFHFITFLLMGLRKLNFFKNLTRLDLCERAHIRPDIFASNVFKSAVVAIMKSAPEKVKTRDGNIPGSLSHWGEDIPDIEYAINNSEEFQQALPPSLTEYNVVLEDSEIFPFHGYSSTKKRIDPHLVIYGARETIKRLKIGTNIKIFNPSYRIGGALLGNLAVPVVYPNLVFLEIHFSLMQGTDAELRQIASSFPNLEELKFFSTFWKRPTVINNAAMLGLKRLKKATLFLPVQTTLPPLLGHQTCRILRDFVVEWTKCGLDLLEEVQFVVHRLHSDIMDFGFCIVSRGDDPTGYTFLLRQVSLPASDELLEPFDPFWTKYRLANKLLMGDISIADRYPEDFISLNSSGIRILA